MLAKQPFPEQKPFHGVYCMPCLCRHRSRWHVVYEAVIQEPGYSQRKMCSRWKIKIEYKFFEIRFVDDSCSRRKKALKREKTMRAVQKLDTLFTSNLAIPLFSHFQPFKVLCNTSPVSYLFSHMACFRAAQHRNVLGFERKWNARPPNHIVRMNSSYVFGF